MRYAASTTATAGPSRMLGFSTAAWKLAPLAAAREEPPPRRTRSSSCPGSPSPMLAHLRPHPPAPDWTERSTPRESSRPSSRTRASPAPSTRHPAGSVSEPPKGAGATTATSSTTPKKDIWSGRSEKTGNESSTGDANPRTRRRNVHPGITGPGGDRGMGPTHRSTGSPCSRGVRHAQRVRSAGRSLHRLVPREVPQRLSLAALMRHETAGGDRGRLPTIPRSCHGRALRRA